MAADGELKHTAAGIEIQAEALLDKAVDDFAGGGERARLVSLNSLSGQGCETGQDERDLPLSGWARGEYGPQPAAQWTMLLKPRESREIRFLMTATDADGRRSPASDQANSAAWFDAQWERTKRVWEDRWNAAFTPGNQFFQVMRRP